ncbi:MAG TPA: hypothetical protein VME19_10515 [Streptosporangiaceae bacterium]|nr:hypothetical protein [Streptosporangiaceae bacterium]
MNVITVAVVLAGLPWAIRRIRGPVAGSRPARLLRTGGYAVVLVLVLVKATSRTAGLTSRPRCPAPRPEGPVA